MAEIPTGPLLAMFVLTIIVSYAIAYHYRQDYDPKKMIIAYLIYLAPFALVAFLFKLKLILIIGLYVFGAVVLVFRNSKYFNE
ncbi:hypothetical protein Hs30E_01110 [Lactococcus hodotermopsidis]|uniref:Uncharacterized protein n=1 Tax=Pseudolactococcus hodotermopsidis TaxID=2709157 RepID=A0A6A0B873_9LACT|nr:hypothetical protein [Lactococcus hodotermopsidis]GFH41560.1 hypothetical protein Hs30E_01110 [Lactococcus hodotermopsidis]